MKKFADRIRPFVTKEIDQAFLAESAGNASLAFSHLERAHVLGQNVTGEHVRVHWKMLWWGVRQRDRSEVFGQIVRLVGAASKTAIGLVPQGNTGGSNVSPFKSLPVDPELADIIATARKKGQSG